MGDNSNSPREADDSLRASRQAFELAIVGTAPGPFEELLRRLEALHLASIETLVTQLTSDDSALAEWILLVERAHEMLRGTAIQSYRGLLFRTETSGQGQSQEARLYSALHTSERRMGTLEHLIHLSLATILGEVLRRRPALLSAELGLCDLAIRYPSLRPVLSLTTCDWRSLGEKYRASRLLRSDKWAGDGFEVIDLDGVFHQLRVNADSAWLSLQFVDAASVNHKDVFALYEQALAFLVGQVDSGWKLQSYVNHMASATFATILSTVVTFPLRVAVPGDGKRVANVLNAQVPFEFKPLVIHAEVDKPRRYIAFVTSPNFFLRDYPTLEDVAKFDGDPGMYLKQHIPSVPTSLIVQLMRRQLEWIRIEDHVLQLERHGRAIGIEVTAGYTARLVAQYCGAGEAAEVLAPFVTLLLKVALGHSDSEHH